MTKRRGLADLWVTGRTETLGDGKRSEDVWVQKPNGNEVEQARRRADAARARTLILRNSPESDEYLAAVADAFASADRDELIGILLRPEDRRVRPVRAAEVADDKEWKEDNYLQGLQDAWLSELAETFALDDTDPEANRVFDELKRYQSLVDEKVDADLADHRAQLEVSTTQGLQTKVAEELLIQAASLAWLQEYRKTQLWLCVRDALNHSERYFSAVHELDALQDETRQRLADVLEELVVDPVEGKDLEEIPSSSTSSEVSDEVETEDSSGLVAVAQ